MGKFKQYLITEDIGLADLGPRLDRVINGPMLDGKLGGVIASAHAAAQAPGFNKVDTAITIPSIERTGRITTLLLKKNPIYLRLSDGTEANFSYDEYRRIDGKPELGKTMTIIFQRHPQDHSMNHSKIDKAIVLD